MITAQAFYRQVAEAGRLDGEEEAAAASRRVLRSLGRVLPPGVRDQVAAVLPGELAVELGSWDGDADPLIERQVFIGSLVNAMDTTYGYDGTLGGMDLASVYCDDDASRLVRAVFAVLRRTLAPDVTREVEQALPPEVADWWRDHGS